MRAVIQRVSNAEVKVSGEISGQIDEGLLVYLGICKGDSEADAVYLAEKIAGLRIFKDLEGRMNLSVTDVGGSALVVSQFTLCADIRKGKRPSYNMAAENNLARSLYTFFLDQIKLHIENVQTGIFQADMEVNSMNDGPVTILADSKKEF